jgi:hypothetical protein
MHFQPSGVGTLPQKPYILGALGIGLGSLPITLTDSRARDAIESYIAAINGAPHTAMAADVGEGLKALSAKLTESQAEKVTEIFFTAIKGAKIAGNLAALGVGLDVLPVKFTDSQAKEIVDQVLFAIKRISRSFISSPFMDFRRLGEGLRAFTTRLAEDQANEAVKAFITAIEDDTDPKYLFILGQGLAALPGQAYQRPGQGGAPAVPRRYRGHY